MRTFTLFLIVAAATFLSAAGVTAQPGSGVLWELTMQMEGMNFGMPPQTECLSKNNDEAPPAQDDCTILDQRSSANHHWIKAQCKDGLMEIDHTRTDTTLTQKMTMTDNSGETFNMVMNGRRMGECDYAGTHKAREDQVAAFQKQADDAQRQGEAEMAKMCNDALAQMQGYTIFGTELCGKQQAEFCRRLNTLDGYAKASSHTRREASADPKTSMPYYSKSCSQNDESLRSGFCRQAASGTQYLGFILGNCPAERAAISARECAGRSYSNMAAPAYRDFCSGAMPSSCSYNPAPGNDGSAAMQDAPPASPTQNASDSVKKSVKGLKKVFGF